MSALRFALPLTALLLLAAPTRAAVIAVEWDPVALDDDGAAVTGLAGYRVFHSTRSLLGVTTGQAMADGSISKLTLPALSSSTTLTLAADATHYVRIAAFNETGSQSALSLDADGSPVQLSLHVPGVPEPSPSTGAVTLTPSLAFGAVAAGARSVPLLARLHNATGAPISVAAVSISGPFAVTANYCAPDSGWNGRVAPGTHCDIAVAFAPAAAGAAAGTLTARVGAELLAASLSGIGTTSTGTGPSIALLHGPAADASTRPYLSGGLPLVRVSAAPGSSPLRAVRLVSTALGSSAYGRTHLMNRARDGVWVGLLDTRGCRGTEELLYYAEAEDSSGRTARTAAVSLRVSDEQLVRSELGIFTPEDGSLEARRSSVRIPDAAVKEVVFKLLDTAAPLLQAGRERSIDQTRGRSPAAAVDLTIPGLHSPVFRNPATLTLSYADADGPDLDGDGVSDGDGYVDGSGYPVSELRVFWHDGLEWRYIGGVVDKGRKTVTAQVGHFSIYALFPAAAAAAGDETAPALEKFLSPALADGINDVATFGPTVEDVEILDLAGRRVYRASRQGASVVTWAGRDQSGRLVESGVYLAKLRTTGGRTVIQRLAVVK